MTSLQRESGENCLNPKLSSPPLVSCIKRVELEHAIVQCSEKYLPESWTCIGGTAALTAEAPASVGYQQSTLNSVENHIICGIVLVG